MERLTRRLRTGEVIMATEYECKYTADEWICVLQERLAAYEDTGLTPEEVNKVRMDTEAGYMRSIARAYGIDVERLKELARADREGRVAVLPCKVGDTVYVSYGEGYRPCIVDRIHVLANNETQIRARYPTTETLWISASDFGETVFLTRGEAEKAIRRAENGN